jgi:uncharacterized UPF0160 family protein
MVTKDSFPISFNHHSRHYTGTVTPLDKTDNGIPHHFKVDLVDYGSMHIIIVNLDNRWSSPDIQNQSFVDDIGSYIDAWYK